MLTCEFQMENSISINQKNSLDAEMKQIVDNRCKFLKNKYFTLIELLVVIAIIGMLAALLLPSLKKAKDRAKNILCVNNLKQIGLGISMYGDSEWFPPQIATSGSDNPVYWYQFVVDANGGDGRDSLRNEAKYPYLTCPMDVALPNTQFKPTRVSYYSNKGRNRTVTGAQLANDRAFMMSKVHRAYPAYDSGDDPMVLVSDNYRPQDGRDYGMVHTTEYSGFNAENAHPDGKRNALMVGLHVISMRASESAVDNLKRTKFDWYLQ